ncbi:MAG: STAS domain-containing protein [Marmoricola sp.]
MEDVLTFDSGPEVAYQIHEESATVSVSGPLKFPDAVGVSGVMKHVIEQLKPLVLLDLRDIEGVDATGVAVLVGIGGDLKSAGIQVRIVASDPRIRHRLPYTLGLRKVFPSVAEALAFQA